MRRYLGTDSESEILGDIDPSYINQDSDWEGVFDFGQNLNRVFYDMLHRLCFTFVEIKGLEIVSKDGNCKLYT